MGAIIEGKCAYTLGSSPEDNPYRKARLQNPHWLAVVIDRDLPDNRLESLDDLECQWDSGYAIAKQEKESAEVIGAVDRYIFSWS